MNFPGHIIQRGELNSGIVKAIQTRLNELSIGSITDNFEFAPLKVDGDFGIKTEQAVKLFQNNFSDLNGDELLVDGKVGPSTWASLFGTSIASNVINSNISPFSKLVIEKASSQVGKLEQPKGSNRGPEVDAYIRAVGLNPAKGSYPWCVAFVFWCFNEAAIELNKSNPMFKTAGVHDLWNNSLSQPGVKRISNQQVINDTSLIKPGQVFCMDFGSGRGHTGLVEGIENGKLITIEGNTNTSGSREGIGVFRRKTRLFTQIDLGFIDYNAAFS